MDKYRESIWQGAAKARSTIALILALVLLPLHDQFVLAENNSVSSWFAICLPVIANDCFAVSRHRERGDSLDIFSVDEQMNNKTDR